jgi:hypothetical protein
MWWYVSAAYAVGFFGGFLTCCTWGMHLSAKEKKRRQKEKMRPWKGDDIT